MPSSSACRPRCRRAIEARIDRLTTPAKQTLNAASVIGARFDADLLAALGIDPVVDELLDAELIDQVRFTPTAEYAFRHPLIRAVAYESQLKSDRAELHRRMAAAIESGTAESADPNAALIAEHLEAAGDDDAAYGWHMRGATWSTHRDIAAARIGWERARQIADELPDEDPGRIAMRIAPRTMLCGAGWRVDAQIGGHFQELRELCAATGDKASLAIGMTGMVLEHMMHARLREASRLASEQMALLESIGDPALTVGAGSMAILMKYRTGEIADVLRWSQTVIDWADGDPAKGNLIVGSPLAVALVWRGVCSILAGPSRVAPGPRRRRRDGPEQRPANPHPGRLLEVRVDDYQRGAPRRRRRGARTRGGAADRRTIGRRYRAWPCEVRVGYRAGEPGKPPRTISADWSCWRKSATCACTSGSTGVS